MTNRQDYKKALGRLDKDTRVCIKHLEKLIDDKFNAALRFQQTSPRVDLSKIESSLDSLQKQIDGLRPKVDAAYSLVQEHDDQEKYLKKFTKNAEEILEGIKQHFEDLYESGYYSEGTRRKIRDEGLIRRKNPKK